MDIAIMIEGQNGLNWPRWKKLAAVVEGAGFAGLYRSDHFTNTSLPDLDSLECWTSLGWLADNTDRIDFGPLVSPVSFRHPAMLARMAASVDDLSGGRLQLGMGAGWQDREHKNYSWDLLDVSGRMDRLEEALEIVSHLLKSDEPLTFYGTYYNLHDAVLLPRPTRPGGPPITIGGNGPKRTLPLVARYASEWNAVFLTPERFRERSARLDELLERQGRAPGDVRRTMMTGLFFGRSAAEVEERMQSRGRTLQESRDLGLVIGEADDVIAQLKALEAAGLERVMLQWLDLDDTERLEEMAELIPQTTRFPAPGR
ncbi:MAG TPA: TIGR03560 family F420-dependent LLM class oxidoreductase [Anaerolineales bacterium]|nr:TIGR03560 family F420-dependent LLM class oxidoreductase [Anaerolineales bacterium]